MQDRLLMTLLTSGPRAGRDVEPAAHNRSLRASGWTRGVQSSAQSIQNYIKRCARWARCQRGPILQALNEAIVEAQLGLERRLIERSKDRWLLVGLRLWIQRHCPDGIDIGRVLHQSDLVPG